MLNLYPRMSASSRDGDGDGDGDDGIAGHRAFYGIAVVCVSIFLFCVLAATLSVWKAGAFAVTAALLLVVLGCFVPRRRWVRRTGRPASAVLALTVTTRGAPRGPGCACAAVDAPPAFAYVCPLDGEQAAAASCVMCSVCLEDVRGGEMVRQVPSCRHIFHVECIDMWLHSHRTCPMCRCVVSPPTVTAKAAEPEEAPETSGEALPPV